jgi:phosphate uptake regulator
MAAKMDDGIDAEQTKLIQLLFPKMQSRPELVPDASRMLWISHLLERYGDHLTNIAEQVVFATEAKAAPGIHASRGTCTPRYIALAMTSYMH